MQTIISELLGQIIIEAKKQGMEQKDLAEKAGISQELGSKR